MVNSVSWPRKYRPKTLEEYVGNDALKHKIRQLIIKDKLPQTMLFQGTQGTGKTTMARLLAKTILCQHSFNGVACENCDTCRLMNEQYIEEGGSPRGVNVYEFDIGKSNTVKDVGLIIDSMKRRISANTKKVYILDEIQRATPEAQGTLLKMAEEPPTGLYIILCTTNPEDLISPFKSRFNIMEVKKPTTSELTDRLEFICRQENVRYSKAGLNLIIESCKKIPRESIMRLELLAATGDARIESVERDLGLINTEIYNRYIKIILKRDMNDLMVFIEDLTNNKNIDAYEFIKGFTEYVVDLINIDLGVILNRYTDGIIKTMKSINKELNKDLKLEIIKTLYKLVNRGFSNSFVLLGVSLELFDLTKPDKVDINKEDNKAKASYKAVSSKINALTKKDNENNKDLSLEDFQMMFNVKEK